MSWAIGYDTSWKRDIGYGVPCLCDHPLCMAKIDRGLGYVCGGEPYGGDVGCGLYFCFTHQTDTKQRCQRCAVQLVPYAPKPDIPEWIHWKLTDESWKEWRAEHLDEVVRLREELQQQAYYLDEKAGVYLQLRWFRTEVKQNPEQEGNEIVGPFYRLSYGYGKQMRGSIDLPEEMLAVLRTSISDIEGKMRMTELDGMDGMDGESSMKEYDTPAAREAHIRNMLAQHLSVDLEDVVLDASLRDDLGMDIIDAAEILMELEDKYQIEIDDEVVKCVRSVRELISVVEDCVQKERGRHD